LGNNPPLHAPPAPCGSARRPPRWGCHSTLSAALLACRPQPAHHPRTTFVPSVYPRRKEEEEEKKRKVLRGEGGGAWVEDWAGVLTSPPPQSRASGGSGRRRPPAARLARQRTRMGGWDGGGFECVRVWVGRWLGDTYGCDMCRCGAMCKIYTWVRVRQTCTQK